MAETNRQLEDEQAAAEATKKRLAAEQAHLRRENDGRIAAKQAARAKENAEDARLLEETMQAAEEKDKDRQQALKDFHVCQPSPYQHHTSGLTGRSQNHTPLISLEFGC